MKRLPSQLGIVLLLAVPFATLAQPYSIDWYTVDGGGGTSAGGNYTLSGTVGQSDAATSTLNGGNYTLQGGFWPGLIVTIPGEGPTMLIQWSGGNVTISWSPNTPGFALEQTDDLTTLNWVDAPDGNPIIIPADVAARFYRLKKP
jgi:hypothetical protein